MIYRKTIAVIILLGLGLTALSQSFTERREKHYAYPFRSGMRLEINNKYGKIHIAPWEKDSIQIDVEVEVRSSSLSRMKRIMNSISFDYTNTDYYIVCNTVYGSGSNKIWQEIKDFAAAFFPAEADVTIDYMVLAPPWAELVVDNKYGDIYLEDLDGKLTLKLSNGALKCNNLNGYSSLELHFANATINRMAEGSIQSNYGEITLRKAGNIDLHSRSSRIRMEETGNLYLDSRHDNIEVEMNHSSRGALFWTDYRIQTLAEEMSLSSRYGNIYVKELDNQFTFINIQSHYTDIDLNLCSGCSFHLNVKYSKDQLYLPPGLDFLATKIMDDEMKQYTTYGDVGEQPGDSKIEISTYRGYIRIRKNH